MHRIGDWWKKVNVLRAPIDKEVDTMPRILQKQPEYMLKDLSRCIVGKMYGRYTQATLAKEFGLTQQAMSQKIRKAQFDTRELIKLFALLEFEPDEILKYLMINNPGVRGKVS